MAKIASTVAEAGFALGAICMKESFVCWEAPRLSKARPVSQAAITLLSERLYTIIYIDILGMLQI
jgi:hypothetical protein